MLTILTYNIESNKDFNHEFYRKKTKIICRGICKYDPDVILLQEYDATKYDLRDLCGDIGEYVFCVEYFGCAIFIKSRYCSNIECDIDTYGVWILLTIDDKIIKIYSHHGVAGKTESLRRIGLMRTFVSGYDGTIKCIFAGDTNCRSGEIENIMDPIFDDCWVVSGRDPEYKFTINGYDNNYFNNDHLYVSRYDRAYITKNLTCV